MSKLLIYIHDIWDSSEDYRVKRIKEKLADIEVISNTYDFDPMGTITSLKAIILDNQDKEIIVIGVSLGGLYAWYCHCILGSKAILVNPVTNPIEQMNNMVGVHTYSEPNKHTNNHFIVSKTDISDLQIISGMCKSTGSDNKKDCKVFIDSGSGTILNTRILDDMKHYPITFINDCHRFRDSFEEVLNGIF